MTDPFRHHPELRELIVDPDSSAFRDFDPAAIRHSLAERGLPADWVHSDAEREADRARTLAQHPGGDLWVFAYGSLIWDPALHFCELRYAFAPHHARAFILKDSGGARGTQERPGVMAALDAGAGCHGMVFRIAADDVARETEILWRRERIGPAYRPAFIPVDTAQGPLTALSFLADYSAPVIEPELSWEEQVRFCATGSGFAGSSLDYVENLARHFAALGIEDPALERLRSAARAYDGG